MKEAVRIDTTPIDIPWSAPIYIGCHDKTIEYAKKLINKLLKHLGSDKKANELFNFKMVAAYDDLGTFWETFMNAPDDLEKHLGMSVEKYLKLNKKEQGSIMQGIMDKWNDDIDNAPKWFYKSRYEGGWDKRELLITSKTDNEFTININDTLSKMLEIYGDPDD